MWPFLLLGVVVGILLGAAIRSQYVAMRVDRRTWDEIVAALQPIAFDQVSSVALDLRSITQGRGSFSKHFSHYDEMPAHLAKAIIEEFQKQHEAAS